MVFLNQSYPTTLTYGYSNSLPSTETLYTVKVYTCTLLQGQLVWELVLTMLLEGWLSRRHVSHAENLSVPAPVRTYVLAVEMRITRSLLRSET